MTRAVLAVVCALLLATAAVGAVTGQGVTDASNELTQQDFDRTEFGIVQYANGSARWTFTFTRTLENESEKSAFRDYADRFEAEETDLYRGFVNDATALTREGSNVTGREMTATGFARSAEVDEGVSSNDAAQGIVRMTFLWTNFAAVDGERVVVADVFEDGLYIGASQSLVVQPGPELDFRSVSPEPTSQGDPESLAASDSVTWQGERSFADERPRVVFGPPESGSGTVSGTPTATDGATSASPTPGGPSGSGLLPWVALGLLVLLGAGAGYAYRTGALGDGNAAADSSTGDGPGGAGAAAEPEIADEELMSDEDRVVAMLEERGGRMKQVNIVEETGWSKSKVSMLLSEMEESGELSKLRVGRENIVSLAGHEPEAAGSPFDDEE